LAPGELLNQDTFYWGTLKGVGKVYVQVVVDTFCSLAFARCYNSKMPVTIRWACQYRPSPHRQRPELLRQAQVPSPCLLAIEDIEHRNTRVRSRRTNGLVDRMNRRLLDECFRVKGRENFYLTITEIRRDLDVFVTYYNVECSHQRYRLGGRTPALALRQALGLDVLPSLDFGTTDSLSDTPSQENAIVTETA
jgi:transposase InsO family protein